jgi:hypothetical protein
MRRKVAVGNSLLLLASGCANSSENQTSSPANQTGNLKSCQMWQQANIEFREIGYITVPALWELGIKLTNSAQTADAKLKESLLVVAEKNRSMTEEEWKRGWSTTPAQDAARDYVVSTCEALGVFIK